MTKRGVRLSFSLDHLKAAVRPLTVAASDVRMRVALEVFSAGGASLGILELDLTDRLTTAQSTAVATFLSNVVDAIETAQF